MVTYQKVYMLSQTLQDTIIGKYLSSLRKLDYVLVRKEGLKTQL